MKVDLFNLDKDYNIVEKWWKDHSMDPVPKEVLTKFGFMAYNEKYPIAAYWLFPIIGSELCMHLFFISNPDSTKEERDEALDLLMYTVHGAAKDMGFTKLMTTTSLKTIEDRLLKHNYMLGDTNNKQFWGTF